MSTASSLAPVPDAFALPLVGAKPGATVQYAPGKTASLADDEPLPRYCVAELVPLGGGTYRVVPRLVTTWLRFSEQSLRKLGIGISENTMHRLGRAGMIRVRQVSPSCYEFEYTSWRLHCEAVEADAEFWDREVMTPAGKRTNRRRYLEAL